LCDSSSGSSSSSSRLPFSHSSFGLSARGPSSSTRPQLVSAMLALKTSEVAKTDTLRHRPAVAFVGRFSSTPLAVAQVSRIGGDESICVVIVVVTGAFQPLERRSLAETHGLTTLPFDDRHLLRHSAATHPAGTEGCRRRLSDDRPAVGRHERCHRRIGPSHGRQGASRCYRVACVRVLSSEAECENSFVLTVLTSSPPQ
jgi:hypothetical protein